MLPLDKTYDENFIDNKFFIARDYIFLRVSTGILAKIGADKYTLMQIYTNGDEIIIRKRPVYRSEESLNADIQNLTINKRFYNRHVFFVANTEFIDIPAHLLYIYGIDEYSPIDVEVVDNKIIIKKVLHENKIHRTQRWYNPYNFRFLSIEDLMELYEDEENIPQEELKEWHICFEKYWKNLNEQEKLIVRNIQLKRDCNLMK